MLRWPVDHPIPCLLLVLAAAVFAAWKAPTARFDFSLEQLYPQDSELARFHTGHLERFGHTDDLMIIAREGDPFHADLLRAEADIADIVTAPPLQVTRL